jgi:hypothetical protein
MRKQAATAKDGRVQQTNFDTYQMLRMNEAPAIEVHTVQNFEPPGGMGARNLQRIVKRFSIWPRRGSRLRTTESAPVRKTKLISIDWTAQRAQIDPRGPAGRERPGNVEELDDVHAALSALQPCDERLILPWLRPRARPA